MIFLADGKTDLAAPSLLKLYFQSVSFRLSSSSRWRVSVCRSVLRSLVLGFDLLHVLDYSFLVYFSEFWARLPWTSLLSLCSIRLIADLPTP